MEKIYSIGRVYAIKTHNSDDIYIGSTTKTLKGRFLQHVSNYSSCLLGRYSFTTSFNIIKQGMVYIELLEEFEDVTREELLKHEGKYIRKMQCVNRCVAGRTKAEHNKQYQMENKDKIAERKKLYGKENKEKISERNKQYQMENKEKIAEQRKKFRQNHKEELKDKAKEYREANTEKAKEYREANKEKAKEYAKAYREANKERLAELRKQKKANE
jgi:hypothetical protein